MSESISIGEVSRLSGCSRETIRHYEKLKLIDAPPRGANGYRYYTTEAMRRLGFIRHARALGIDLETIRDLLALSDDPEADCATVDLIASQHLQHLEARVASLQSLTDELRSLVSQCRGGRVAECRIIEALFGQT